jgi:osmotically-inducible protein OsmY
MKNLKKTLLMASMFTGSLAIADNSQYDTDDKLRDAWIDGKVESALLVNRHLNNFTIDTDVVNNVVFLSGTVKSDVDKELAEAIAKSIKGVDSVDNKLMVKKETEFKKQQYRNDDDRSFGTWYDDSTITASIKSQFLWNGEVDGLDINVNTRHGEVTLEGETDSSAASNLAEQIAKNTTGVTKVTNKLTVVKNS